MNEKHYESTKPSILAVDDASENVLVLNEILGCDYRLYGVNNGEKAIEHINKTPPDLVLLDVVMPGMSGYEVCKKIKSKKETQDILVIF